MNRQTFLNETLESIKFSGHTHKDIIFIGSEKTGHSCTWQEFEKLADFTYDNGFGSTKIATDLKIVFSDGATMWRGEYDGSEWWEYSQPFKMPTELKPIRRLGSDDHLWDTLEDMNSTKDKSA